MNSFDDSRRKVLVWSTVDIKPSTFHLSTKLPDTEHVEVKTQLKARIGELRGNKRAIRTLVFAQESGLIIGGGFDHDIYAWDPWARLLQMKLVGHIAGVLRVIVAYCPAEHVISIDETAVVKVWNCQKDIGGVAELVQSVSIELEPTSKVIDMSVAFDEGKTFVVQTNRLHFFSIDEDSLFDMKPVRGGLGYCSSSGGLVCVTQQLLTLANIRNGRIVKRLFFIDEPVSEFEENLDDDANDVSSSPDISTEKLSNATVATLMKITCLNSYFKVNPKDLITVVTFGWLSLSITNRLMM